VGELDDEQRLNMQVSITVLEGLLEKMKVHAAVDASYVDMSEESEEPVLLLDIVGDDLSILIGRRSETLNALQYITNLIVGKELGHWIPLIVDVQGYRTRRERQLRQLARRMADQAVQTSRRQVLEPMPANERRVIHLELRNHPDVVTRSVGEEPYRKVTISLK
jgi:spoIIIJ-associated protein